MDEYMEWKKEKVRKMNFVIVVIKEVSLFQAKLIGVV